MTTQSFSEMNAEEFHQMIDSYIDRAAAGHADVPADVFFDLLAERIASEADKTVNLSVDIVDSGLEIHPHQESGEIVVRGNEIWIGKHRLILHLSSSAVTSSASA